MRLGILFVAIMLQGCITVPQYDLNEHLQLSKLDAHSQLLLTSCDGSSSAIIERLYTMQLDAMVLGSYSAHLPNNKDIAAISLTISNDINEMLEQYINNTPSAAYCKFKSRVISHKTLDVLNTLQILQDDV